MSKIIVVYGGGFQPFHAGHLSSYLEAKEAFPNADFYVAASNDTKTRPIPFDDKKFLAQQAGVSDPFVQVKEPINPKEILDRYSPKQDIFILIRSERDPMGYTKKDGSPGYFQPFTDISKCEPFGYHGYVFVTHKKEFKLNGQVVYSGTQVRDMYANSDDKGRLSIIKQLYPQSQQQKAIKQMLDQYIGSSEPIVEPDTSAIKQLKAKKLKEQIQRMRPLLKEGTIEQKYKFLKLMKEAIAEGIETINGSKYSVDPDKYYVWAWDGAAVLYGEYDNINDAKINLPKIEQRAIERLGPYAKDAFELSTGKDLLQRYGKKEINEISDETIHSYLSKADRQISNRQNRMSQARERLNKNYEIYDVNNPTKIIDKFEANTPELARRYFEKFIKEYNPGDQNFEFEVRRSTGLSEDYLPEK